MCEEGETASVFAATKWAGYIKDEKLPPEGHEPAAYIICLLYTSARLSLDFRRDGDKGAVNLSAYLPQSGKKVLCRGGAKLSGTKEMIGNFRAVLFCPAHLTLVSGGPALRRNFLDIALSQLCLLYTSRCV